MWLCLSTWHCDRVCPLDNVTVSVHLTLWPCLSTWHCDRVCPGPEKPSLPRGPSCLRWQRKRWRTPWSENEMRTDKLSCTSWRPRAVTLPLTFLLFVDSLATHRQRWTVLAMHYTRISCLKVSQNLVYVPKQDQLKWAFNNVLLHSRLCRKCIWSLKHTECSRSV